MTQSAFPIEADWKLKLNAVLDVAQQVGPHGMMVFDLDSTVFDNLPRQARIVREFGKAKGIDKLLACTEKHFTSGWDLAGAVERCGLSPAEGVAIHKDLKAFWGARFFTSAYCVDDIAIPGAPEYLQRVVQTKTQLLYVTGRHEAMRQGSVDCMKKCGMPVPGASVTLMMKPQQFESDDVYKRDTHAQLEKRGQLVAAFDNEPTHVNDYATRFPGAIVVHLATDHSGRPVTLNPRIFSVPSFLVG